MVDYGKDKKTLVAEVKQLRARVVELEKAASQQKRAKEAAEKERDLLRTMVDALPDQIFAKDTESRFVFCNQETANVAGKKRPQEMIGKSDFDFNGRDNAQQFYDAEQQIIDKGEAIVNRQYCRKMEDGGEIWVTSTKVPWRDSDGNIIGIIGMNRDITDLKLAQEALGRERNLLRSIVDTLPERIFVKDRDSKFIFCNKASFESIVSVSMLDLTKHEDLTGKSDFDIVSAKRAKAYRAEEQEIIRTGRGVVDREGLDGQRGWISTTKIPWRDDSGEIVGIVGLNRDITVQKRTEKALQKAKDELEARVLKRTAELRNINKRLRGEIVEHKRAEKLLRASERRYRNLVESLPDVVWTFSDKHGMLYASSCVKTILGYSPDHLYKNPWLWNKSIHSEDQEHIQEAIEQFRKKKKLEVEYRIKDAEGNWKWLHDRAIGKHFEDGEMIIEGISTDITERKNAEEALACEHNLLRALVETLPDRIFVKDINSVFVMANPACADIRHVPLPEDMIGRTDFDYMPREMAQPFYNEEQEIIRTGEPMVNREFSIEWDEQRQWVSSTKVPWYDDDGNILGLIGLNRDITKLKLAVESLARERNLLMTLVKTLPDLIFVKDVNSAFVLTNPACANIFKVELPEDMKGKTDFDYMPREMAQPFYNEEQKIIRTGEPMVNREFSIEWDGRRLWISSTKVPWYDDDGNIMGVIGLNRDITELKAAQEEVVRDRNLLRTVVDNILDCICVKDMEGRFVLVNRMTAKIMAGAEPEEVIGKTDFDYFTKAFAEECYIDERSIIESGEPLVDKEETGSDWAGKAWCRLTTKVPLRDIHGKITGIVGIGHDIIDRKRAEQELQRARDELEIRVEKRTADLKTANEELRSEVAERKRVEKQLLVYQSHLRSLASELTLAEERVRRRIAINLHDHIGQNLAISKIKLESLRDSMDSKRLTDDLGEIAGLLSQIIESSRSLTFELCPPVLYELGFIPAMEWLVRQMRKVQGIAAEFVDDGQVKKPAHEVSVLLFQAVRELLVNVAKHSKAEKVRVSAEKVGDEIEIVVSDDGVGFDTSKITFCDEESGGLGLFSTREQLGYIGGRFEIESERGIGTTVTVAAPLNHRDE